jgi:hypothetical protein
VFALLEIQRNKRVKFWSGKLQRPLPQLKTQGEDRNEQEY